MSGDNSLSCTLCPAWCHAGGHTFRGLAFALRLLPTPEGGGWKCTHSSVLASGGAAEKGPGCRELAVGWVPRVEQVVELRAVVERLGQGMARGWPQVRAGRKGGAAAPAVGRPRAG